MARRGRRHAGLTTVLVAAAILLALPAEAVADPAAAAITACTSDGMTVAGQVALSGRAARKARGAALQMRFQALALFGFPHVGSWQSMGSKARASAQQQFTGLGANSWIGYLEWRYNKGARTVVSGSARSQPVRIAGKTGRASCLISEGAKPPDNTPPSVSLTDADGNWHHAPVAVRISATDDFSGVARVQYALDGGAPATIPNNGTLTIASEGAHNLVVSATDVAGNTATQSAVVRVDAGPPSKPVVTGPPSASSDAQPTISWTPASDSGSGVRGYFVTVRAADGSTPVAQGVDAATTSLKSPVALADNQTYTVTVTAVDNTADPAWSTNSDPYTFHVDTSGEVSGVSPAPGSVLSGSAKSAPITITLSKAANPSSVPGTVTLQRNSESGSNPAYSAACAGSPCTTIKVTPSSALPEGRYTLSVNGLQSADGSTIRPYSGAYAVPFLESASGPSPGGTVCVSDASLSTTPVSLTAAGAETGTLDFDWSYASGGPGWEAQAMDGSTPIGNPINGTAGNGHSQLTFPLSAGSHSISFTFTSKCPGAAQSTTKLTTTNLVGTRVP